MKNGQVLKDLGGEHIAQSQGRCIVCNCITWGYVGDPCPDWRGHFGNRTHDEFVAEEYGMEGPDVPICALCMNTGETYRLGLERAKKKWKEVSDNAKGI